MPKFLIDTNVLVSAAMNAASLTVGLLVFWL